MKVSDGRLGIADLPAKRSEFLQSAQSCESMNAAFTGASTQEARHGAREASPGGETRPATVPRRGARGGV